MTTPHKHLLWLLMFVALIAGAGILYALYTLPWTAPPVLRNDLKTIVRTCAEQNSFAVTPAPTIYTNVNGLTDCLWMNNVTVAFATAERGR